MGKKVPRREETEYEQLTGKDLYNMDLHESIMIAVGTEVMRVPGGWIYTNYYNGTPVAVMVQLNGEFGDYSG